MEISSVGDRGLRRLAMTILFFAALSAPIIAWGALSALRSTSNDPRQWLPQSFGETDTYDWFEGHFGTDEIAVVSWPGCEIDQPSTTQLADAIADTVFFDRVRTGANAIEELTASPLRFSDSQAVGRLRGILVGQDGVTTCLICSTSTKGQDDRVAAVSTIEEIVTKKGEIDPRDLKLAGPTVDAAMIDAESRRMLFGLAGLSGVLSFGIAAIRLRSLVLALAVLMVAVYCTGSALAILYYSGGKMNLLMTMLPPLIYVLTVSSCVHLVNYYRDEQHGDREPALLAIRVGWFPCSLAAITTGVGLISLGLSTIEPIRDFGWFSAVGVVASVGVMFVVLPALLLIFDSKPSGPVTEHLEAGTVKNPPSMLRGVMNYHTPITIICLIVMSVCIWRIPSIKSTVKLQDRFLASSDAIADYRWLEENVGPMVPLEIVVHFRQDDSRDRVDQVRVVRTIQAKIQSSESSVSTFSAVNLAPALPRGHSVRNIVQRKVINGDAVGTSIAESGYLRETVDETLWRISVRAPAIGDLDYGILIERIREVVQPTLDELEVTGTFTGIIPLIYKAQRQLLVDLFRSFLLAFAIIAAVLLLVLRSLPATLAAMIPNLFPAVIVFGGIEMVGIPVQIGSVMTASAALGIAVDDTVHFLTWFRRGLQSGLSRRDAISEAFDRCASAMLHTTMICAGGLCVFALSTFVPILHFAYLMVLLLAAALVGDLLLLPAILIGPAGKLFEVRSRRRTDPTDET